MPMSFKRPLNHIILLLALLISSSPMARAAFLLIPMDKSQTNHLKAYGIAYWSIERGAPLEWLLNYRGGSFLVGFDQIIEQECLLRGVKIEVIADAARLQILEKIAQPNVNMDAVKMEKAPKIAVYAPEDKQPWDDAVMMALEYAEIPYEQIYDGEILDGKLKEYDWLHLHHEDFTGQYGRFYRAFNHMAWYQKQVAENEAMATRYGFQKVSQMKLQVALTIKAYVANGGFLFSMCSGADSFDIALASEGIDICAQMYDGDPVDPEANSKLDFSKTLAFHNFKLIENPLEYEFSTIDATQSRRITENQDYFTLFEFSAKWDPVPTMLCQNHTQIIKGFMGQTTAFLSQYVKPTVVVMGENKSLGETRYIHGEYGQGTWTFYGGHDPEDYQHLVGDPPTDLSLYPNSPGYRLILNNILFPAARKKKLKT
jgi:hypothetical protein